MAQSEIDTAHKNRAIANLMRGAGTITHAVEAVIAAYCRQCAITLSCRQLARAALPLAADGFSPVAEETIFPSRLTRRLNALLLTCGTYDSVGSFAYRVGLPAKSGVGGGILAVVPGQATIAVWSPELDKFGSSVVGTAALEYFDGVGFQFLPVMPEHAAAVDRLPLHHRDPFDRLLIAQAAHEPMYLVSRDPLVKLYDCPQLP